MSPGAEPPARAAAEQRQAAALLRACVHCGFCNQACPTYGVTGDELDGPRGRIQLIRNLLEERGSPHRALRHLDRCLTCRACESACPSGVQYGRLLEYGRQRLEAVRPPGRRLLRRLLCMLFSSRRLLAPGAAALRAAGPLLPGGWRHLLRSRSARRPPPPRGRGRRVLLFEGCVQPPLAPSINAATARLLHRAGVGVPRVRGEGCCGALHYHQGFPQLALGRARANIDAWWPQLEAGAEALVVTASGCAAMIRDYPRLLEGDPLYSGRAAVTAGLLRDPVQLLAGLELPPLRRECVPRRVALHVPCTQAHALGLPSQVGEFMGRMGFELAPGSSPGACCGSAGAYSLLQPRLGGELRHRCLEKLTAGQPQCIATANIGCLLQLRRGTELPVLHWIELVEQVVGQSR